MTPASRAVIRWTASPERVVAARPQIGVDRVDVAHDILVFAVGWHAHRCSGKKTHPFSHAGHDGVEVGVAQALHRIDQGWGVGRPHAVRGAVATQTFGIRNGVETPEKVYQSTVPSAAILKVGLPSLSGPLAVIRGDGGRVAGTIHHRIGSRRTGSARRQCKRLRKGFVARYTFPSRIEKCGRLGHTCHDAGRDQLTWPPYPGQLGGSTKTVKEPPSAV